MIINDSLGLAEHIGAKSPEHINSRVSNTTGLDCAIVNGVVTLSWDVENGDETGSTTLMFPFLASAWDSAIWQLQQDSHLAHVNNLVAAKPIMGLIQDIMGPETFKKYMDHTVDMLIHTLLILEADWHNGGVVDCPYTREHNCSLDWALAHAGSQVDIRDVEPIREQEDWQKELYVDLVNVWDLHGDGKTRVPSHVLNPFWYTGWMDDAKWKNFGSGPDVWDMGDFLLPVTELFENMLQTSMSGHIEIASGLQRLWDVVWAEDMVRIDQFMNRFEDYYQAHVEDTGGPQLATFHVGKWSNSGHPMTEQEGFSTECNIGMIDVNCPERNVVMVLDLGPEDGVWFLNNDEANSGDLRRYYCGGGCFDDQDYSTAHGAMGQGVAVEFYREHLVRHEWNTQLTMPGFDPIQATGPQLDGSFLIQLDEVWYLLPPNWAEVMKNEKIENKATAPVVEWRSKFPIIVILEQLEGPVAVGDVPRYNRRVLCPKCYSHNFHVGGTTWDLIKDGI